VRIGFLADHPELIGPLAAAHHGEWGALYGDAWTADDALAELRAQGRTYPVTLVALDTDGTLLGSVSAIPDDAPGYDDRYAPWLASLWVTPGQRGRGIGGRLVTALEDHMRRLGTPRLHLVTPEHRTWYEQRGWTWLGTLALPGTDVDLMARSLTV
jgi:predicted N-acetyltransferase YhbS